MNINIAGRLDLAELKGIISLHGARITEEDFSELKKPVYYVSTKGDTHWVDKEKIDEIMNKKDFCKLWYVFMWEINKIY